MQGAIEDFAQELALVIRRFLKLKAWRDTERIVVGGGFRASRVGELAIGRAAVILKAEEVAIDLRADPQRPGRGRPDRRGASGAALDVRGARRDPGGRHRRHQHPRRRGRAQSRKRQPIFPRRSSGSSSCGVMPTRRTSSARTRSKKLVGMLRGADQARRQGRIAAGAVHRHRLPGHHRAGRHDRARRAEPAGQLGEQPLQPAAQPAARRSRPSASTTPSC